MAPKKFANVSCAANPMASPPTERDATSVVVFTPRFWSVNNTARMIVITFPMFRISGTNCSAKEKSSAATERRFQ
jgi:hypothetical protein